MNDYGWKQLSQWDSRPDDAHFAYKDVDTGMSKTTCAFVLVERTELAHGVTRFRCVEKSKVTQDILTAAGKP